MENRQLKSVLFLFRRYNDIDHMVPIIYRMAKEGHKNIKLFCLTPTVDIANDFRLNFLEREFGLKTQHIYEGISYFGLDKILPLLLCRPYFGNQNLLSRSLLKKIFLNINNFIAKHICQRMDNFLGRKVFLTRTWSRRFIDYLNPSVLVVDWQKPERSRYIIEECRSRSIAVIAVPHGIVLMTNDDSIVSKMNKKARLPSNYEKKWDPFDHAIVNSEFYKDLVIKYGAPSEKVKVIGATRYSSEWGQIYKKILPPFNVAGTALAHKSGKKKINIVFMDHSAAYRMRSESVVQTMEEIISRDDVNLIIKPSTGSLGITYHRPDQKLSSSKLLTMAPLANDVPSLTLIQWADVVISVTSSICIEVLYQNKIFLYPKYFHDNEMVFEETNACWMVNNLSEVDKALDSVAENPAYRPYGEKNVEKFVTDIVYGGVKNRDVLGEYVDFILAKANQALGHEDAINEEYYKKVV